MLGPLRWYIWDEVPSFADGQGGRKEVGVPDVNVQKWAIHQQSLVEWLLGGVYGFNAEYEMRCSELLVYMHKNLWPKYKIKVPHMHNSKIRFKSSSFCKKSIKRQLCTYVSKPSESFEFKTSKGTQYWPTSRSESRQGSSLASQLLLT